MRKLRQRRGGVNVIFVVLVTLVVIGIILVAIPIVNHYREEAKATACKISLNTATDQLTIAYLQGGLTISAEEARQASRTYALAGWDDLCPGGGKVYLVHDEGARMPYKLVCGIHDEDSKQRTRLNAFYVREQIQTVLQDAKERDLPVPDSIPIALNGETLTALRTDEALSLSRGTYATSGYEGTVVYFAVTGLGNAGDPGDLEDGALWYFAYADEDHAAIWAAHKSWYGDSYND